MKNQQSDIVIRIEHLALNVANPLLAADWYVKNLSLVEVFREHNNTVIYVADADKNFALKIHHYEHAGLRLADLNLDAAHIAFEGTNIEARAEKMVAAGAQKIGPTNTNAVGDTFIDLVDPFGFKHQLLNRVSPFFTKPTRSNLRFEHLGLNVPEQKDFALWYIECVGLEVSWSKDLKGPNKSSNYRVPYVGDRSKNMSFELYAKDFAATPSFANLDRRESYIGFATNHPNAVAQKMINCGGTLLSETNNAAGDLIIELKDPWGFQVQLIRRQKSILDWQ
jgi:glyoxylase I family protein